jgi:signal transduction histidine kinase/CheY-like chemotaxis protein
VPAGGPGGIDSAPDDTDENDAATLLKAQYARLDTYFGSSLGGFIANVAVGLLLVQALWGQVPGKELIAWYFFMALSQLVRIAMRWQWRRDRLVATPRRWTFGIIANLLVTGALWGAAPLLFFDVPVQYQSIIVMAVGMMNAGATAVLAAMPLALYAFTLSSLPPVTLRLLQLGTDFGTSIGLGMAVYTLVILVAGRSIASSYATSIRLRFRNEQLVGRLRRQTVLLEQSASRAEVANRAKSDFLATVSHEIRTPVNAVLGGIEILSSTPLDERQTQCVRVIDHAGQSLMSLLDDILDISRIEAGRLTLEVVAFDLPERLRQTIEIMTARAAEKGLAITLDIDPAVPRRVWGDPVRLRQILLNLLGNAVKFTERGGVTVAVRPLPDGDGPGHIRLTVSDTGIGIAPEHQVVIFNAFSQADGSISRQYGGAGLGLAIVQHLVKAMGGEVRVESDRGSGSRFHIDLPLQVAPAGSVESAARPRPVWHRRPRLLLVEDEPVNRFIATQLLERHGFEVLAAGSGMEALEMLSQTPVDAVLMDLSMAGMDGFETANHIRALPAPTCAVPILALTANVLPETIQRCREVGMQGFMSKPIRLDVMLHSLAEVIPPDDSATPPPAPAPPASAQDDALAKLTAVRRDLGDEVADALADSGRRSLADGCAALREAWAQRRLSQVSNVAHRMVGALQVLGLGRAVEVTRTLELAARHPGADVAAEVEACLDAVAACLAALEQAAPRSDQVRA